MFIYHFHSIMYIHGISLCKLTHCNWYIVTYVNRYIHYVYLSYSLIYDSLSFVYTETML